MDPGRRAMIYGSSSKPPPRDITSPRRDPNNRVTKPSNPSRPPPSKAATYLTEDEQSRQFIAGEDKFVLKQAKKKADIRVRERRAKPIDYLVFNFRWIDDERDADFDDDDEADVEIRVPAPQAVISGIKDVAQLKELDDEVTHYHILETNPKSRDYWRALQALCAERMAALRPAPERRVTQHVSDDIDRIFESKTVEQLRQLEKQISAKLQSTDDIDTDYWEELLRRVPVYMARGTLKQIYDEISAKRLQLQRVRNPDAVPDGPSATDVSKGKQAGEATEAVRAMDKPRDGSAPFKRPLQSQGTEPPPGTARFAQVGGEDFSQATKALYEREVARGIGENEEVFTAEEDVSSVSKPQWADKYRPRKPKYFNRVQMGYEWNKYNQTHYDHDNPPPKVVQGYKFNIFYPDLIDATKTPTYKIIREHGRRRGQSFAPAGEEDTCLIRFIAGPPYEDIAFRIVDREWDYSAKKDGGFKAEFKKVCDVFLPALRQIHAPRPPPVSRPFPSPRPRV